MHNTSEHDDLLSMLKNLGFKKAESQKRAAWAIAQAGESAPLDVLVKLALQSQAATAAPAASKPKPQEPRTLVRIPEIVEERDDADDDVYAEDDNEYVDLEGEEEYDAPPPPPRRRANNRPKSSRPTRSHPTPAGVGLRQPLTLPVEASPNSNYYITVVYECAHGADHEQPRRRNQDRAYERPERAYGHDSRGRRQLTMGRGSAPYSVPTKKPQKDSNILEFNWHLALTCAAAVILLKWLNIL